MAVSGKAHIFGDTKHTQAALRGLDLATEPIVTQVWLANVMYPRLLHKIRARFASEGDDAVGGQWAPLADATQEIRRSKGYSPAHPINVRSGALYNFVTNDSSLSMTPISASLAIPGSHGGSNELIRKLTVSMMGYDDPATPARPVLGLDVSDAVWGTASLAVWLMGLAAATAGKSSRVVMT